MENNFKIIRTTSEHPDFAVLVALLDKSLWAAYPELASDYWGNNILEINPNVVIVYSDNKAVSCSCFKKKDNTTIEIKRMFVADAYRGNGLALVMLEELESWATDLGFTRSVLETLYKQEAAMKMYAKAGYENIDNYPPYVGRTASICMGKNI
ncbi:GNAT family N-acetyltransferase [Flavobacterium sp. 14A]|uniref:GNAT family N-acetyltransferase n=1 Tax=Flavobacterium sp. 14A TaxID=2735896 RepID=UPI0015708934|nr:GNAT superfamily N-acetyltransferase [Flavobacterium sp. 14A]